MSALSKSLETSYSCQRSYQDFKQNIVDFISHAFLFGEYMSWSLAFNINQWNCC